MNILVIGSGGREHSLCWAIAKSPLCDELYCAPGNGGIADIATCVDVNGEDSVAVIAFCRTNDIGFVVVGPEAPLVKGIVDDLTEAGIKAFGPCAEAAQLEGSKGYTKDLCFANSVPTSASSTFENAGSASDYIDGMQAPYVIKADGLAAGKGVIIAETSAEANKAIDDMFGGTFGLAGAKVVIEEFLVGEEASFFALVDGENVLPLATAQDHKRVGEGDTGPNTGGMGAYSPAPVMTPEMCRRTMDKIILPTVRAMKDRGAPYKGVLYAGLMITAKGPELIEYNVRFGDPECQVLMVRLKSDMVALLLASVDGQLKDFEIEWDERPALTVVLANKGYPGSYEKGSVIGGLEAASAPEDVEIFHAGTAASDGGIVATGGRVLNVTAIGESVSAARDAAYAAIDKVDWAQGFCRRDIGWQAIEREKA